MTTKETEQAAATPSIRERAIDAYDAARERASIARSEAREGLGNAPLLTLGGGLALGAVIAALLPKTRVEDRVLGTVGGKITGGARAAANAAKEAGREKLSELNITRDAGASAVQSLVDGLREAAKTSGEAALGAVRKKG